MPGGRPTKLDQVARIDPDGSELTAADVVVERVRLGLGYQSAADSAGVSRRTLHNWRLNAARLRTKQAQGKLRYPTAKELTLIGFLDALERAEAEAEANRLAIIARAAQGGAKVSKTTTRFGSDGEELERTVVDETVPPQWTAAAWFLERRIPERYAKRVEVTGAGGSPLVSPLQQARDLSDQVRQFKASDEIRVFQAGVDAAQDVAADVVVVEPDDDETSDEIC